MNYGGKIKKISNRIMDMTAPNQSLQHLKKYATASSQQPQGPEQPIIKQNLKNKSCKEKLKIQFFKNLKFKSY